MNIPNETATLLADLLREIILTPKDFSVRATEMSRSFTIHIQANFPDHKKLIGGMRKHYLCAVSLAKRIASKHGYTAEVAPIAYTGQAFEQPYKDFVPSDAWPKARIVSLIARLAAAVFEHPDVVQMKVVDGMNGTTNIDLLVSQSENPQVVSEMNTVFKTLIRPIGKNNGRTIYFNIVADIQGENEVQPASADGRFAKAVPR